MSDRRNIPVRSGSGNIGAGLTRINLGAGVASLLDDRKESRTSAASGLTPARTLSLLGTNVSRARTAGGTRYQSAYNRLGGLRNASVPNVSLSVLAGSRVTTGDVGDTTNSVPPPRTNTSLCETNDTSGEDGLLTQTPEANVRYTGYNNKPDVTEDGYNQLQTNRDVSKVSTLQRFQKDSSQPKLCNKDWYSETVAQKGESTDSPRLSSRYTLQKRDTTNVDESCQLVDRVVSQTIRSQEKHTISSNPKTTKDVSYNTNRNTSALETKQRASLVKRNKSFDFPRQSEIKTSRTISRLSSKEGNKLRITNSSNGQERILVDGNDNNKRGHQQLETVKVDMPSRTPGSTPVQDNKMTSKPSPYDGLSERLLERQKQYRYLQTDVEGHSQAPAPVGDHLNTIAAKESSRKQTDNDDDADDSDDDPYASINDATIETEADTSGDISHRALTTGSNSNRNVDTGTDDTYLLPTPPRRCRTKSGDKARSGSDGQQLAVSPSPAISEDPPQARVRMKRRLTTRNVGSKRVEEDEFIGFASLPEQVHRKAVRRGFEFTLMVVGETGLGKSTLINSLFLTDIYKSRKLVNIEDRIQKTVDIEKKELEIEERGVKLKLTIVDTPGFNDNVNADDSWKPIVEYIDKQFDGYFRAESGLNRKNLQDTRVHCCLYFISPYGHGLRPVDISVMKKLHNKVNIVPLIAKADMLTKPEVKRLKERVLAEVERHRIQVYQFPDCDSDEDEDFKQQDKELKASIPFAVVGSNTVVEAGGRKIRGRMYPWGIVEVENPKHCDFMKLRQMLISTHMQDLKDVTCDTHYENYRAEHIAEQMSSQQKERNKLKRDSSPNVDSMLETDKLLQQKDEEIRRMQAMLSKMQAQLHTVQSPQVNGRLGHQV